MKKIFHLIIFLLFAGQIFSQFHYDSLNFILQQTLISPRTAKTLDYYYFGFDMKKQDSLLVIGAPGANSWSGLVYLFKNQNGNWKYYQTLFLPTLNRGDAFGSSLAIYGNYIFIIIYFKIHRFKYFAAF